MTKSDSEATKTTAKRSLSVAQAYDIITQHLPAPISSDVVLHQSLGRVLCEEITANRYHPPYDISAMDGYAIRHQDCVESQGRSVPPVLQVVDDIRAGVMPKCPLQAAETSRIMTGAAIPTGCDTVVRVEDTSVPTTLGEGITEGENSVVQIDVVPKKGANIRQKGEHLVAGAPLLSAGTVVNPAVLALLAMVKKKQVPVYALPTVAILSTGDELEAFDDPFDANKIPDSNSHALYAQCLSLGITPTLLGIAKDNEIDTREKLSEGLKHDLLLCSGGVSVGHHDFVRPVLASLGIVFHFWRVAMKPGHPLAFGTFGRPLLANKNGCNAESNAGSQTGGKLANGGIVFGLPGNPVSSMVCFEQFVRPALRQIMGNPTPFRRPIKATLTAPIKDRQGRTHIIRVSLQQAEDGSYLATPTGAQGSGILTSMARADGLMVVPEQRDQLLVGEQVTVQLLERFFD